MKISVLNRTDSCPNSINEWELYFGKLEQELDKAQLLISHIVIEGQPIYADFTDYIKENILAIHDVEIVVCSLEQYISEIVMATVQYTEKAVNHVGTLATEFYQIPSSQTWSSFSDFLEGMQWIIEAFVIIEKSGWPGKIVNYQVWNEYAQLVLQIQEQVENLSEAMQSSDTTLIGDIISYDIKPNLQVMQEVLRKLLISKVNK